eukprot:GCRY01001131.1.p1 GENE.GCRY01001131.1~~GCRY01001131.1.p1  ORF type:complete len:375 (-),score=59.55 GCRY01001131.1:102-1226(-)
MLSFDIFQKNKTLDEFREKTTIGGVVSIVTATIVFLILFGEVVNYFTPEDTQKLYVDPVLSRRIRMNMDITFPRVPCSFLTLDVLDAVGETNIDVEHTIFKRRLDRHGNTIGSAERQNDLSADKIPVPSNDSYCGSCYGAGEENECCNTCSEVREAYRKKGWAFNLGGKVEQCKQEGFMENVEAHRGEGCNIYGYVDVHRVMGNVHFAPGYSFQQGNMHVHDLSVFGNQPFDFSHTINQLSFGKEYPGLRNPLDNVVRNAKSGNMMYQYYLEIVPTTYVFNDGITIETNQYSKTETQRVVDQKRGSYGLPGVFFIYDISPLAVTITEKYRPFTHLLTSLFAIIGGVFSVMGIFDALIFHGIHTIEGKIDLGKQG